MDETALVEAVRPHVGSCALGAEVSRLDVCPTLREASTAPYFYECLFDMAQKPIKFGAGYDAWRRTKARLIKSGKEIWYLGRDD